MGRLLPYGEVQQKLAALHAADVLGRQFADDLGTKQLAKEAGALFAAHTADELEKEAGLRLLRAGVSKIRGAAHGLAEGVRARRAVGKALRSAKAGTQAASSSSPAVLRRRAGKVTPVKPRAQVYSGEAGGVVQAPAARTETVMRRGRSTTPAPTPVQSAPYRQAASPGNLQPATKTQKPVPKSSAQPNKSKVTGEAAGSRGSLQPPTGGKQERKQPSEPPQQQGKRFGWGKALGLGTLALGGYGVYKAAPIAGRILENTSTTPMAYSMGWSPVPYGYGYTPYGSGTPTMGRGA